MDDIQRKLKLIDAQLTPSRHWHEKIITTSPLLLLGLGLAAGIMLQNTLCLSIQFWLSVLAVSTLTAVLLFAARKQPSPGPTACVVIVCFLCLGAIRLISFTHAKPNDIQNFVAYKRKLATIRGFILTEPYVSQNNQWAFAAFEFADPVTSFYLKLTQVETTKGWANVAGTIRVWVDEPALALKAGDYIQAYCWLNRFKPPTNPGQFDVAAYLARRNVFVAASVKSSSSIELLKSGQAGTYIRLKRYLKQKTSTALLADVPPDQVSRSLIEALLLGQRANIDRETYAAFRKTGLLHFISLSGMHLGILIGIIWWLCTKAGLRKRGSAAVCIIAVTIFLMIVPARAPTVRAAIICYVFCMSFFFGRRHNPINTLALAAIILLMIRPTQLFEAGWQLSFACVLGILLFSERIYFFIHEIVAPLPLPKLSPKAKPLLQMLSDTIYYLTRFFSVSFAAWLAGAGILLYHFHTITPLTCLWTVIVFPIVAGIVTLGFLKIVLAFLLPTAAVAVGIIVTGLADLLVLVVTFISRLDFSYILIGAVPVALIIGYYCLIGFAAFVHIRRYVVKKAICAVLAATIVVFLSATKWHSTHHSDLVLTCLDVGHGQAILAQAPFGSSILFDAGSLSKNNVGDRIIMPFLNEAGLPGIDAIIISHNDIDHINAIPEVVEGAKVRTVYANNTFFSNADRWSTAKFLNETLLHKGHRIAHLNTDSVTIGSAQMKVLWPTKSASEDQALTDNDKSLVVMITFAGRTILLTSDIEQQAQRKLLQAYPKLKADVLIGPHHGSVRTLEPAFLQQLEPDILICSCGRRAYESQAVVKRENTECFYTAADGAVTVRIGANGLIKTESFAKNR